MRRSTGTRNCPLTFAPERNLQGQPWLPRILTASASLQSQPPAPATSAWLLPVVSKRVIGRYLIPFQLGIETHPWATSNDILVRGRPAKGMLAFNSWVGCAYFSSARPWHARCRTRPSTGANRHQTVPSQRPALRSVQHRVRQRARPTSQTHKAQRRERTRTYPQAIPEMVMVMVMVMAPPHPTR